MVWGFIVFFPCCVCFAWVLFCGYLGVLRSFVLWVRLIVAALFIILVVCYIGFTKIYLWLCWCLRTFVSFVFIDYCFVECLVGYAIVILCVVLLVLRFVCGLVVALYWLFVVWLFCVLLIVCWLLICCLLWCLLTSWFAVTVFVWRLLCLVLFIVYCFV